MCNFM